MRWPLRYQMLLPMVGLVLAALVGVSLMNSYLSARHTRARIERELEEVVDTVTQANFPLTDAVLRQMRGLSGAEFALVSRSGKLEATSRSPDHFSNLPEAIPDRSTSRPLLARPIQVGGRNYFHTAVELRQASSGPTTLHVLYPEQSYRQAWRDVVYPPLLIGGAAMLVVAGLSFGIAAGVTRPLSRLRRQVEEIAEGRFESLPVPRRNDEIADLSRSVNRMAEMLARYESEVRRNEQLRTLGQLGGGMAHQLRNSVTGCRMAVELHARDCSHDSDSLRVALRQLNLMERYLQRFLSLGRAERRPHHPLVLEPLVEDVVALVGPAARHLGVTLQTQASDKPVEICGDRDALGQLLVNLIINGVEAAAERVPGEHLQDSPSARLGTQPTRDLSVKQAGTEATAAPPVTAPPVAALAASELAAGASAEAHGAKPHVTIAWRTTGDGVELMVEDTGPGPGSDMESRLFEPFVTGKPDGTGLGLAVAREIVAAHDGRIRWERRAGKTCFLVELPPLSPDP